MLSLNLDKEDSTPLRLLCLGAHCDDIEIGCGGTLLTLLASGRHLVIDWVVFSSSPTRKLEAENSFHAICGTAEERRIGIADFRNGYFPQEATAIKDFFEDLKKTVEPDLILTHHRGDRHQDHRCIAELTWNTFRNNLILEYEIPKYDGDLGKPNVYLPITDTLRARKIELLCEHFPSQSSKHWFDTDLFTSLMRIRGMESAAPSKFAEAFYGPKISLTL